MRYILGITIITAVIIFIRALTDGKILKRQQYALWLFIPVYMIISPFFRIGIPVDFFMPEKTEPEITTSENMPAYEMKAEEIKDKNIVKEIIKPVNDTGKGAGKVLKNIDWRGLLYKGSFTVSVIILIFLAAYNLGFLIYCKHKRKYIGRTADRDLQVFGLDHKETPFLLFNKIYIENKNEDLNKYIICHEECHHKHGDQWWIVLRFLVLALNWYNPIIWIAFFLSGHDCELACDEEVIRVLGEDSSAGYAETLFELIKQRSEVSFGFRLSAMIRGEYKIMRKRLVCIKHPPRRSYRALTLCLVTILVFTGCVSIEPISAGLSYKTRTESVSKGDSGSFPVYKNVARQINDDGWVYTFVYEYEKEGVDKIDGLIRYYFNGVNVRYRYAKDYYDTDRDGITGAAEPYRTGWLIFGKSKDTASDSAKIVELLEKNDKESLLALDPNTVEFTSLDKDMFFRLMKEALTGNPQAESNNQTYWDFPECGPMIEKDYIDGYKFQIGLLHETGLIDVCYIDVLYKTGSGPMDYVQLSDLVENGTATEEQIKCFKKLQQIASQIEEKENLIDGIEQYKDTHFGDIDMKRLSVFLENLDKGNFEQYISE